MFDTCSRTQFPIQKLLRNKAAGVVPVPVPRYQVQEEMMVGTCSTIIRQSESKIRTYGWWFYLVEHSRA